MDEPPVVQRRVDDFLARYPNPRTRKHYRQDLDALRRWCSMEDLPLLELSSVDLERYRHLYLADTRGLSESTQERRVGTALRFFDLLLECGDIPRHPVADADRSKHSFRRSKALGAVSSRSAVSRLVAAAATFPAPHNAIVRLLAVVGARSGELEALNVADFLRQAPDPSLRLGSRVISLDGDTAEAIAKTIGGRDHGPMFMTSRGTRADRAFAMRLVGQVAEAAGLNQRPTSQALRNFAMVTALAQGSRRKAVADVFGITDIERHDALADAHRTHTAPTLLVAAAVAGTGDEFRQLVLQAMRLADDESVHPSAAISLAGATLERYLRKLGDQRRVPMPPEHKQTIEVLANLLIGEKVIQAKLKKRIDPIASLRNDAAHGRFEQVTRQDAVAVVPALEELLRTLPKLQAST